MTEATRLSAIALLLCGCGIEVHVGAKDGIKPISGDVAANTEAFTCGQPIEADGYSVESSRVGTDCQISFDRDVVVATAADYDRAGSFKNAANLLRAVELEIRRFSFIDADTGEPLSLDTYIRDA